MYNNQIGLRRFAPVFCGGILRFPCYVYAIYSHLRTLLACKFMNFSMSFLPWEAETASLSKWSDHGNVAREFYPYFFIYARFCCALLLVKISGYIYTCSIGFSCFFLFLLPRLFCSLGPKARIAHESMNEMISFGLGYHWIHNKTL